MTQEKQSKRDLEILRWKGVSAKAVQLLRDGEGRDIAGRHSLYCQVMQAQAAINVIASRTTVLTSA